MRRIIFCILICCYGALSAQQPAAQKANLFFEKVYLHTDREMYATGEDIWFKAYLVNAQTNKLSGRSNNLYVELISPDAKIQYRHVIRLEKGLGNGDFKLGDSIAPGTYRIRAYTNWMRNFGDSFIFEKHIGVVGDSIAIAPAKAGVPVASKSLSKDSKASIPVAVPAAAVGNNPAPVSIRFFPEGGSLTVGVPSIVAIKAEGSNNSAIAATGKIVSATGGLITEFTIDNSGMGLIYLPAAQHCRAEGTYAGGRAFSIPLPVPQQQGFSLMVRSTDSLFKVAISTNNATLSQQAGKPLTLTARSKGQIVYSARITMEGLRAAVNIPKADFPAGLVALTLYDAAGKPWCERLVYAEGGDRASVSLVTDKAVYKTKEKAALSIKVTDANGQPLQSNLSLTVVDAGTIPPNISDVATYLNLTSELRGSIDSPARYFDERNPRHRQDLDLLLLTQGWRDFLWKRLADSALKVTYAAEQWLTVSGTVTTTGQKKALLANANITLSAPGARGNKLFSNRTDSAGRYYFDNIGLYGRQVLKLTSRNDKGLKFGAIKLDSLYSLPLPVSALQLSVPANGLPLPGQEAFANRNKARKQSINDTIQLKEVQIKASRTVRLFDGTAMPWGKDEVFVIKPEDHDYTDLTHYLQHRSAGRVDLFQSENNSYLLFYYRGADGKPVYPRLIVNGKEMPYTDEDFEVMEANQNNYLKLQVDKVEKVVIKHMMMQSLAGSELKDVYIIYLTLKPGALMPPTTDVVAGSVTGYYQARTFYAPQYEAPSGKPDLRTTIHWEPNIITNEKGEAAIMYYNADPKANIRIIAEGITATGQPVVGTTIYQVK